MIPSFSFYVSTSTTGLHIIHVIYIVHTPPSDLHDSLTSQSYESLLRY